jgi:hypothetical protein
MSVEIFSYVYVIKPGLTGDDFGGGVEEELKLDVRGSIEMNHPERKTIYLLTSTVYELSATSRFKPKVLVNSRI